MPRRFALITGASAGIGAAFARIYASNGYDVALTARRSERLEELSNELSLRYGVEALVIPADLAEPGAVDAILGRIAAEGREVDALVNNAGYSISGAYVGSEWAAQAAMLQVLVGVVCEASHKVLPGMLERRFGRIVNVASLAGLIPASPHATLYGACKSFLVKFSQTLHLETLNTGVHVSALCPGLTYSEFHDVDGSRARLEAATPEWMWMGADEVAAHGYEAVEANRPVSVTGAPNKAIAASAKLIPDDWGLALIASQGGRFRPR